MRIQIFEVQLRDVTAGVTGAINSISTKGGRFCPTSQNSHQKFPRGYISATWVWVVVAILQIVSEFHHNKALKYKVSPSYRIL